MVEGELGIVESMHDIDDSHEACACCVPTRRRRHTVQTRPSACTFQSTSAEFKRINNVPSLDHLLLGLGSRATQQEIERRRRSRCLL